MTHILITSSVLIAVILLARRLFRGKVSHKLLYCAWLLVAARLLIPFQFGQWNLSIHTLTENIENHSQAIQQVQITLQEPVVGPSRSEIYQQLAQEYIQQGFDPAHPEIQTQIQLQIEEQITAPTVSQVLTAVWVAGMAVMAVWFLTANLIYLRRAKRVAVPYAAKAPVPVCVSKHVPTPCLVGLFRPVIYLTPASIETPEMTRHVLTHELTHLRHGDHIWSLVRCICLCVYWFNPLVWIAAAQSRRDCELACDESALQKLGDSERIAYGKTLLATVTRSASPTHLLQTATAMNESKKQLKERVCFIVKKPKNLLIAAVCLVLIAAFAAGCAFTGSNAETTAPTEPTDTTLPIQTDNSTEALQIVKDAVSRYVLYRCEGLCCDYELIVADLSQYLTDAQKEEYRGQQYKITCCHDAEQVRDHIDRALSKDYQDFGYPDSKLFRDGDGNLYATIIPKDGIGYRHFEVISQTDSQIVARACRYDEDECYRNDIYTLHATQNGYQITKIEEAKDYRCEAVIVEQGPGYQIIKYGAYYDYALYDSEGNLRVRRTTDFRCPTVTQISEHVWEIAVGYGPGIIQRTYWNTNSLQSEVYDYAIANGYGKIAYLDGDLEHRTLVVCDIFDQSDAQTYEHRGFAPEPMPVSEAAFSEAEYGFHLTLTYCIDKVTETTETVYVAP